MDDCLFCKIAAGDIPCGKVYEDETVLAFHDIDPKAPVHILLIPKEHIAGLNDMHEGNSGIAAHILEVAARLAVELNLEKGYRIVTNVGEDGGQSVPHLHFHLLGGRCLSWPPG